MRRISVVATCCVALICVTGRAADPQPYVAIRIDYFSGDPVPAGGDTTASRRLGEQRGSGVVVGKADGDSWYVLTNAHVVDAGPQIKRAEPNVFALERWRKGRVVARDDESDLALIEIRTSDALPSIELSAQPPSDGAAIESHGLVGGQTYCARQAQLKHALPLPGGVQAWAPHRYYVHTTFRSGESGGAVTFDNRLVALIHGNDPAAGWGLVVDHKSITDFLKPFLEPEAGTAQPEPDVTR
jgi:hypothetical protein